MLEPVHLSTVDYLLIGYLPGIFSTFACRKNSLVLQLLQYKVDTNQYNLPMAEHFFRPPRDSQHATLQLSKNNCI